MLITGKHQLKKPLEAPLEALMFATPEGNLVIDDPKQEKLDLKVTGGAPKELKVVPQKTA